MRSLMLFLLFACSHQHHGHNSANVHMHKKSHEELIRSFNDPKRDLWQKPEQVLKLMGDLKQKKIIDIGSGSGYFTRYFLEGGALVTAADVDEKFQKHIRDSFPDFKSPKLHTLLIGYDNPGMEHNTYDYAFTSNTYHHIENRIDYFTKVLNGLKVGGKVVVLDFKKMEEEGDLPGPPMDMRIAATKVVEELLAAGFGNIETFTSEFKYQYLITGTKIR